MDGENNGKPYVEMGVLGGKPTIFGVPSKSSWFFQNLQVTGGLLGEPYRVAIMIGVGVYGLWIGE